MRAGQSNTGSPASASVSAFGRAERGATQHTYTGTSTPSARSDFTVSSSPAPVASSIAARCSSTGTTASTSPERASRSTSAG